jgi:hypothetical protein
MKEAVSTSETCFFYETHSPQCSLGLGLLASTTLYDAISQKPGFFIFVAMRI